jgi:hypothetical protein
MWLFMPGWLPRLKLEQWLLESWSLPPYNLEARKEIESFAEVPVTAVLTENFGCFILGQFPTVVQSFEES